MEDGKVLLTRARELEARIVSEAERIEADRRLPKELVRELAHLGFFRTCLPRSLGGLELHPATQVDLFAELSRLDGSTGWCVMIGATSAVVAAYLPKDAAAEIYGKNADVVTGGVFAPRGTAVPVEGG